MRSKSKIGCAKAMSRSTTTLGMHLENVITATESADSHTAEPTPYANAATPAQTASFQSDVNSETPCWGLWQSGMEYQEHMSIARATMATTRTENESDQPSRHMKTGQRRAFKTTDPA